MSSGKCEPLFEIIFKRDKTGECDSEHFRIRFAAPFDKCVPETGTEVLNRTLI